MFGVVERCCFSRLAAWGSSAGLEVGRADLTICARLCLRESEQLLCFISLGQWLCWDLVDKGWLLCGPIGFVEVGVVAS